jgi:hypothetical protein
MNQSGDATDGKLLLIQTPNEVNEFFFNLPNPSGRARPWGLLNL